MKSQIKFEDIPIEEEKAVVVESVPVGQKGAPSGLNKDSSKSKLPPA
jgi:hypothetical protein